MSGSSKSRSPVLATSLALQLRLYEYLPWNGNQLSFRCLYFTCKAQHTLAWCPLT